MSLYPSLEDMQVDKIHQAQRTVLNEIVQSESAAVHQQRPVAPVAPVTPVAGRQLYPALGTFLGLELTDEVIRQNMPEYLSNNVTVTTTAVPLPSPSPNRSVVAPLSGGAAVAERAQVTHNIRELILCKDAEGKVGLRVQAINNGVFVSIVVKGSPAALAGLRFGDQILQINGTLVSGFSVDKLHKMLQTSGKNNISIVVRDRPFERTITLFKDSTGNLGFQFKNGKITAIVKDSSAARNGVLTEHNLLEVNGQTVVAMKDKEITKIINEADRIVKITVVPKFIFDHMVKKLSTGFLRGIMDHSAPEF